MRHLLATWLLCLVGLSWIVGAAAAGTDPTLQMLSADASDTDILSGAHDAQFVPFDFRQARRAGGVFWLKMEPLPAASPGAAATINITHGRHLQLQLFSGREPLQQATSLPGFRSAIEEVFLAPAGNDPIYVRVEPQGRGHEVLKVDGASLDATLARSAEHARMIALTFGALMAMALSAFLIWFVLREKLLLLYASLFSLQAVYMAFLSGEAFGWPVLSSLLPVASYTWNVTAALSGAIACLFVREIADLKSFSPRVYAAFGWVAFGFVVLAAANLLQQVGLGPIVAMVGNLVFLGAAVFTLVAAFMAWRRSNRAAGFFLLAWGLLETFTIATALRLLLTDPEGAELLLFYGLPLSMVAAAVLIALGVADRLRDQRLALNEAERRAQTDPLTGVLNRRSLVERLDAACLHAQARGLPIALLFIDLDHFKQINDSFGHLAGDACLKAIIPPLQAELRQSDVIGRYGGEEFVVILSSADASAAEPIAERIRQRVADVRVEGFGQPIQVTCSIGIATSDMLGVWGEHLIAHADTAVYAAKRSGRNRVQLALAA
ncbi:MAG TPA: diguanylate cyclase [Povalibacter sp.]|uniref:sensor domain-containing diguanylate cyclase n=1 Tax=Povalibacter sp. TaxID=1962978 RepID=UPI002C991E81|nr:diguanylate cyclase [Povalibacter sp.]HMN46303.1 diguanylate cyclase [Povalibacter sp.]